MFWKRTSAAGGFWGLLAGTVSSIGMWAWVTADPSALRYIALSEHAKAMAENMYRGLWSFIVCVLVTLVVSLYTKPKSESELVGLVRGCTDIPSERDIPLIKRPIFWAAAVAIVFVVLNIIFW
jgi:SSS family solute:Na+ symporter